MADLVQTSRINDGALLFLQYTSQDEKEGSRIGIVFNGSPFSPVQKVEKAISGRWIIENDWLKLSVLPDQLFYNTGISTIFG